MRAARNAFCCGRLVYGVCITHRALSKAYQKKYYTNTMAPSLTTTRLKRELSLVALLIGMIALVMLGLVLYDRQYAVIAPWAQQVYAVFLGQ